MHSFKYFKGIQKYQIDTYPHPPINIPNDNIITNYEPLRQNRFNITFPEIFNIPQNLVTKASGPSYLFDGTRISWEDMTFTLIDHVYPSISRILQNIDNDVLFQNIDVKLEMLDPTGIVVNRWVIYGAIKEINHSNLDYNSYEYINVSIIMAVNYAILEF